MDPFEFEQVESADDLVAAAASSIGFWDNPEDDEDWNADSAFNFEH
jgi:hypothetical protein